VSDSQFQYIPAAGTTNFGAANADDGSTSVTSASFRYGYNQNVISDGVNTLTYDVENRLIQAETPAWGTGTYLYDAEGRVCAVESTSVAGTSITGYFYDAEGTRVAKGNLSQFSCNFSSNGFSPTYSYVLGLGGEQVTEFNTNGSTWAHTNVFGSLGLLATYGPSAKSGVTSSTYFALNDWLGTKRAEVGADGCVSTFQGLPFGDGLVPSGNCPDATEHHFTGKERDTESGNDYFGARYYASSMGRWMSPDWAPNVQTVPYADFTHPQTLNLYNYMRNNPLGGVDADGHGPIFDLIVSVVSTKVATYVAQHPEVAQALSKVAGSLSLKVNGGVGLEESIGKSGFKGSAALSATGFWQFSSKGVTAGSDLKLGASIETPITGKQSIGGTSETISKENGEDLPEPGKTENSNETGIGNFTSSSDGTLSFGDETGFEPDLGGKIDVNKSDFMGGMNDLGNAIGNSILDTVAPTPPPPQPPPPPPPQQ
jgi:RHS repeat-associated protein